MAAKILFICKKRMDYSQKHGGYSDINGYSGSYGYTGTAYGLGNSASFVVNFLNQKGIEAKLETAVDGNDIDRLVTNYNPTHVIIEAIWVTPEKFKELMNLKRHRHRLWIMRLHSKLPFIAYEGIAFPWLLRYKNELNGMNFLVAPNTEEFASDLEYVYDMRATFLPNIYLPNKHSESTEIEPKLAKTIDVGCFGAIRPMKNHLCQAVAACKFANDNQLALRFHINASRTEQAGEQVLKNLRSLFAGTPHQLIEHPWMNHCDFIKIVRKMDIGLQISFSETFDIVAGDFVDNNIPIVVSDEITWLPWWTKVKDINSTEAIDKKMTFVWWARQFKLHYLNKIWLRHHNRFAGKLWLDFLLKYHI